MQRVMMGINKKMRAAGLHADTEMTFKIFAHLCAKANPPYGQTIIEVYDRIRAALKATKTTTKVDAYTELKIKAFFYDRSQEMNSLEQKLGNKKLAQNSLKWRHPARDQWQPGNAKVGACVCNSILRHSIARNDFASAHNRQAEAYTRLLGMGASPW